VTRSVFGERTFDRWTPLLVRGRQISGHVAAPGLIQGNLPSLYRFATREINMGGQRHRTGVLTAAGRPVADVAVWFDRYGVACAGLLRNGAITASASLVAAEPWPVWELDGHLAHLTAIELDRSRPTLIAGIAAAGARERAEARINAAKREHALHRIEKARR
jgi:hypothetical protein